MGNVCKGCGYSIPEGAKFCPKCGTPVDGQAEVSAGGVDKGEAGRKSGTLDKLDIFFYVPMGICLFNALMTMMFLNVAIRWGVGGAAVFSILINLTIAGVIWIWPYKQYKQGNIRQARVGVVVFAGLSVLFFLIAVSNKQMLTGMLDVLALASFAYLFYKLGGDSWSFEF